MMTADPIIVLAKLITVLEDVSVPVSFELFSKLTFSFFYYYEMNLVFFIAWISASIFASSSAKFILFYLILNYFIN